MGFQFRRRSSGDLKSLHVKPPCDDLFILFLDGLSLRFYAGYGITSHEQYTTFFQRLFSGYRQS